jgi:hypothetical protein
MRRHRISYREATVAAGAQNIPGTLHQMRWQGTDTECGNRGFAYLARPRIDALKECCGGAFSAGFVVRRIGGVILTGAGRRLGPSSWSRESSHPSSRPWRRRSARGFLAWRQ